MIRLTLRCLDDGQLYVNCRGYKFTYEGRDYEINDTEKKTARQYLEDELPIMVESLKTTVHTNRRFIKPNTKMIEAVNIYVNDCLIDPDNIIVSLDKALAEIPDEENEESEV